DVQLWSKSGKPLARYFPEVAALFARLKAREFILDGELLIVAGGAVSFDALQMRLHPAESRIRKLSSETPALFMAFDCLAIGKTMLSSKPLSERCEALEKLLAAEKETDLRLSPATGERERAIGWLERTGGALDGVIAKRLDLPY